MFWHYIYSTSYSLKKVIDRLSDYNNSVVTKLQYLMYNAMVQSTRRTSKTDTRKQVGSIQVRGELLHVGWYRGFWIDDI